MDELLKSISENPDQIGEFTTEQVDQANEALRQFYTDVESGEVDADDEVLDEVAALNGKLNERRDALAAQAEARAEKLASLRTELGIETQEEDPGEADDDDDEDEPATETPEVADEPEPVTAAAEVKMGGVAKRIPKDRQPRVEGPALVASGGKEQGERITDRHRLGELMNERRKNSAVPSQGSTKYPVARFDYRSEFHVDSGTSEEEGAAVLDALSKRAREPEALTAALAFCAPAQPVYEQFGSVSRDGLLTLPTVTASRGRITYPNSLSFQDLTDQAGIGSEWTGEGNKSVYEFVCPETTSCEVVANVTIIQVNNATARFYPEAIADLNAKAMATAAQDVNARHIDDIVTNSKVTTLEGEDTGLGGIGNLANNVAYHAANYREKYRLSLGAVLDVVFPHWVFDALWADAYARDSTNTFGGIRAQLAQMLSDANVRPQFVYGWQGISGDQQGTFRADVDFLLWEPGTVVRLDSGTLDLGVVRDSTLNATNDYQTFVETFEAICVPGHEIYLINDVPICPSGATGDRVTVNCAATPS